MKDLHHQIVRFGMVGGAATATHFIVALALISMTVHPLWANAWAFLIAFQVSFFGHRGFTFRSRALPVATSVRRFAVTALCGFALSEMLLAGLLRWTEFSEPSVLAIALATVATLTFLMGRFWAFASPVPKSGSQTFGRIFHYVREPAVWGKQTPAKTPGNTAEF